MNSRERFFAFLDGRPVDRLPVMPITMMFAADRIGVPYGRYALDHRVLAEAQIHTAQEFSFDHVSAITETREARDCGAAIRYFDDQPYAMDESRARLADKSDLAALQAPDPLQGEAMGPPPRPCPSATARGRRQDRGGLGRRSLRRGRRPARHQHTDAGFL